ncbi:hypothetical protein AGMMS4952_04520 [Spirochaetia bacterium]|nr:hypothetical protein AGMMS4952_04520 [Spirochaetia bacterium]
MNRRPCLRLFHHFAGARKASAIFGGLLFLAAGAVVSGQEIPGTPGPLDGLMPGLMPGLRERAVVLNIVARIVEQDDEEIWNSNNSKVTIMGRPVSLKLIGENVVVYVQFTPYRQENGRSILVAQGQIWINVPNEGVQYQTTLQSIPMEFGEQVYFFPLGKVGSADRARIEIQLELLPYTENTGTEPDGVSPG